MNNSSLGTAALYILLTLSESERHGYSIMKEVERMSSGEVRLGPATLYTTLKRLLAEGLIVEIGERTDPTMIRRQERRRYYALSAQGKRVVRQELGRMEQLVKQFKAKLA